LEHPVGQLSEKDLEKLVKKRVSQIKDLQNELARR
jgi:hypothetical protein